MLSGVGSVGPGGKQFVLNSVSRDSLAVVQRDSSVSGVDSASSTAVLVVFAAALWKNAKPQEIK